MKKTLTLFIFTLALNASAEETKPVLIKSTGSFQLNPIDKKENEAVFNYQRMMENCFNSSNEFRGTKINYKVVTDIINKKIKSISSIPTISCSGLITDYKKVEKR